MKTFFYTIIIVLICSLTSCSEYQKLLKSSDYELKFNKAIEYYNKKKYIQSQTLLDDISTYYKGTERSQEVLYYLAKSYFGQKNYSSCSEYFKTYMRTFAKGAYAPEAKYMIGHCYYLDSPEARLDQAITLQGIKALQEFVDMYPEDERVPTAVAEQDELSNRLAYKELMSAKLYYNLGNYMGNNYLAAVATAQNALKQYPATTHKEALLFLILEAKYAQAVNSIDEKRAERYQETVDEYYSFINEFPAGKSRNAADKIFKESNKIVEKK
ncbi:MAG: outer membrane protein assembly factor BamD [Prevotellaceae bacterium]|jgi:outer membrane protein assembly factor BamD|nr:outer membrane protein assembly factor BamD [Prevotellaceae bacterium]